MMRSLPNRDPITFSSFAGVDLLLLHVSSDERILYANTAFCNYFGLEKQNVLNESVRILTRARKPTLTDAVLAGLGNGENSEKTVTDESGRIMRVVTTWKDEGAFFSIDDISQEEVLKSYVSRYVLRDFENLSEADLTTLRFPERRFMTVSFADLRGFTTLSERMQPDEVRGTLNSYLGCMIKAVEENLATVDKIMGDGIMVLYGAPRYYRDHALRAVKTALDQQAYLKELRERMAKEGKRLPECGIAIHTGEMVVGNIGTAHREDYTVVGANVNLASRICDSAEGGQVLVSESTFLEIVDNLPKGWKAKLEKQDSATTLPPPDEPGKSIIALDIQQQGASCTVGPAESPTFRFRYVYAMQYKGVSRPVPILEATALERGGVSLSDQTANRSGEKLFGKYRLHERIGRGRSSEVWKATDEFGNRVALKILQSRGAEENVKRFEREAQLMRHLDHPHICRILEFGVYEGKHYIAMEFVGGAHLREWLDREFPQGAGKTHGSALCPQQKAVQIMTQVLFALEYAHSKGIIHRDLKPQNIMIKPNGTPVIMDFGLGRFESATHSVTLGGEFLGSIDYMAPEQAKGAVLATKKADIFSAGAILFLMLTGKKWYKSSGNILADTMQISKQEVPSARKFNAKIQRRLNEILSVAMRRDPTERYDSAQTLANDLEGFSQRVQRAKPIKALVLGIIIAGLLLIPILVREKIREYAQWGPPIYKSTFSPEEWNRDWLVLQGGFQLRDSRAITVREELRGNLACFSRKLRIPLAIEMDVEWDQSARLSPVYMMWKQDTTTFFTRGKNDYHFRITAIHDEHPNFSKFGDPLGNMVNIHGRKTPTEKGKVYRIRIEIEQRLISLYKDGELVCSFHDPFPLAEGFFALGSHDPGKFFGRVEFFQKGVAEKVSALGIGDAFQTKGYYADAIEAYDRIVRSKTSKAIGIQATLKKSHCLVLLGNPTTAESLLDSLTKIHPSPDALLLKGDLLRHRGEHKGAAGIVRRIGKTGDKNEKAMVKAKLHSWLVRKPQMIYIRTAQSLFPADFLTSYLAGQALINIGNVHEVLETYRHIPVIQAQALLRLKRYDEVLEKHPENRLVCAKALLKKGDWEQLIREYQDIPHARATALFHSGKYQQVIDEYSYIRTLTARSMIELGRTQEMFRKYQGDDEVMPRVLLHLKRYEEVLERYPKKKEVCQIARRQLAKRPRGRKWRQQTSASGD